MGSMGFRVGWWIVVVAACGKADTPPKTSHRPLSTESVVVARGDHPGVELVRLKGADNCGHAAITMTLNFYGHRTNLDQVLRDMPPSETGVSALEIVNLAEARGLGAMGIEGTEIGNLLQPGDILHVDHAAHWVTVERSGDEWGDVNKIQILDPAVGKRIVDVTRASSRFHNDQFVMVDESAEFSGVALLFAETPRVMKLRAAALGLSSPSDTVTP